MCLNGTTTMDARSNHYINQQSKTVLRTIIINIINRININIISQDMDIIVSIKKCHLMWISTSSLRQTERTHRRKDWSASAVISGNDDTTCMMQQSSPSTTTSSEESSTTSASSASSSLSAPSAQR